MFKKYEFSARAHGRVKLHEEKTHRRVALKPHARALNIQSLRGVGIGGLVPRRALPHHQVSWLNQSNLVPQPPVFNQPPQPLIPPTLIQGLQRSANRLQDSTVRQFMQDTNEVIMNGMEGRMENQKEMQNQMEGKKDDTYYDSNSRTQQKQQRTSDFLKYYQEGIAQYGSFKAAKAAGYFEPNKFSRQQPITKIQTLEEFLTQDRSKKKLGWWEELAYRKTVDKFSYDAQQPLLWNKKLEEIKYPTATKYVGTRDYDKLAEAIYKDIWSDSALTEEEKQAATDYMIRKQVMQPQLYEINRDAALLNMFSGGGANHKIISAVLSIGAIATGLYGLLSRNRNPGAPAQPAGNNNNGQPPPPDGGGGGGGGGGGRLNQPPQNEEEVDQLLAEANQFINGQRARANSEDNAWIQALSSILQSSRSSFSGSSKSWFNRSIDGSFLESALQGAASQLYRSEQEKSLESRYSQYLSANDNGVVIGNFQGEVDDLNQQQPVLYNAAGIAEEFKDGEIPPAPDNLFRQQPPQRASEGNLSAQMSDGVPVRVPAAMEEEEKVPQQERVDNLVRYNRFVGGRFSGIGLFGSRPQFIDYEPVDDDENMQAQNLQDYEEAKDFDLISERQNMSISSKFSNSMIPPYAQPMRDVFAGPAFELGSSGEDGDQQQQDEEEKDDSIQQEQDMFQMRNILRMNPNQNEEEQSIGPLNLQEEDIQFLLSLEFIQNTPDTFQAVQVLDNALPPTDDERQAFNDLVLLEDVLKQVYRNQSQQYQEESKAPPELMRVRQQQQVSLMRTTLAAVANMIRFNENQETAQQVRNIQTYYELLFQRNFDEDVRQFYEIFKEVREERASNRQTMAELTRVFYDKLDDYRRFIKKYKYKQLRNIIEEHERELDLPFFRADDRYIDRIQKVYERLMRPFYEQLAVMRNQALQLKQTLSSGNNARQDRTIEGRMYQEVIGSISGVMQLFDKTQIKRRQQSAQTAATQELEEWYEFLTLKGPNQKIPMITKFPSGHTKEPDFSKGIGFFSNIKKNREETYMALYNVWRQILVEQRRQFIHMSDELQAEMAKEIEGTWQYRLYQDALQQVSDYINSTVTGLQQWLPLDFFVARRQTLLTFVKHNYEPREQSELWEHLLRAQKTVGVRDGDDERPALTETEIEIEEIKKKFGKKVKEKWQKFITRFNR